MAASDDRQQDPAIDPERIGLVWVGTDRAVVARWTGEPTLEHLDGAVSPKRRSVGSVRRGPARPSGGGRVAGHGTENRHEQDVRRFLTDLVGRLGELDAVEVVGRAQHHERLADLLRRLAARHNADTVVTTRTLSRRPSDKQLIARLRKLVGAELPRQSVGRHRLPATGPTTDTGRPLRPAAGRRTLRPPRLSERREIDQEVESMLADGPWDAEANQAPSVS
jgi:hypothetical protein